LSFLCLFAANCAFAYSGGNGEPNTPYKIANVADLLQLAADTGNYDKCFILTADIDLASYTFTAAVIAPDTNNSIYGFLGTPFTGVFDGNEHKITNLTINSYGGETRYIGYLGLFGCIEGPDLYPYEYKDVVRNLIIENVTVTGNNSDLTVLHNMGGLAGYNSFGAIRNCHSTGTVTRENGDNTADSFGGLIGYNNYGSVNNCSSAVIVSGGIGVDNVGGLVGYNNYGIINNCFATGNVSGATPDSPYGILNGLGGLVGWNYFGIISGCWASGNVNASGNSEPAYAASFGGLVGYNEYGGINKCYATGNVTSTQSGVGGLVGSNGWSISNCYATGNVIGRYDVGGLAGGNGGPITNCYAIGNVIGSEYIGGLVGSTINTGTITNCYSIGAVAGGDYFGGLIGYNYLGTITASFWDVDTSGLTVSDGGTGKTTVEMKKESTFTSAGWDFVGETVNGIDDIWWILENVTYPKLNWQRNLPPDPCGPGGGLYSPDYNFDNIVNFVDFAIFADAWMTENPFISLDNDNDVDIDDLKIFCDHWLLNH
jgi:hypothetical protein